MINFKKFAEQKEKDVRPAEIVKRAFASFDSLPPYFTWRENNDKPTLLTKKVDVQEETTPNEPL